MQATVPIKIGAAFLSGVLVAALSAVVYVRSSDPHPKNTLQIVPAEKTAFAAPTALPVVTAEQPDAKSAPAPVPVPVLREAKNPDPAPVPVPVAKPKMTRRPVSLAVAKAPSMTEETVVIAQGQPAAYPPLQMPPAIPAPPPITAVPRPQAAHEDAQPFSPPQSTSAAPGLTRPQPHTVTLDAGTEVAVRVGERISTDRNYSGDTFRATLDKPIIMGGYVIADKGSKVLGRIVKAEKPGKMSGTAEISLALTELNTTDGQRIPIQTNESLRRGPSNTNSEIAKMGGGAALGAIIGAIAGGGKGAAIGAGAGGAAGTGAVLLGHGKPAVIDNETRLSFLLSTPTTITEQLN